MNKTVLDLMVYSAFGYAFGIGASVLFRGKGKIRNIAAGVGGSYAYVLNMNNFNKIWLRERRKLVKKDSCFKWYLISLFIYQSINQWLIIQIC